MQHLGQDLLTHGFFLTVNFLSNSWLWAKSLILSNFDWFAIRQHLHKVLTRYRWAVIVLIVIPISFLHDLQYRIRSWLVWWFLSAPTLHNLRVQRVQDQVKRWAKGDRHQKMVIQF